MPNALDALIFLSRRLRVESVSELKSPFPSNGRSSTRDLVSGGSPVFLSQANLRIATAELRVLAEDARKCLVVFTCCLASANPSDCHCNALDRRSAGKCGITSEKSSSTT